MHTLLYKFYETIKPFWDFRFLLICTICLGIGFLIDPAVTKGMLLFCLFVPVIWAVALLIAKVLRPGVNSGDLIDKAEETPLGAAIVYFANRLVLIAIALSFVMWWVRP